MYFDGEFRKIDDCDISGLIELVKSIPEDVWSKDDSRQKTFEVHKSTQTIKLIHDEDFRHTNPTTHPAYTEYKASLKPALISVKKYFDGQLKYKRLQKKHGKPYFVRMLLTRLAPQGEITKHRDKGHSLSCCHRIHLPIVTNEKVSFFVGDLERFLRVGELWEINNRKLHAVNNASDVSRIHLIMDYVIPGEKVKDPDSGELIC